MIRDLPKNLLGNWKNPNGLIQVLIGPRQVGKTTAAIALADPKTSVFFSADSPTPPSTKVIEEQWIMARGIVGTERTLVLDEIQKIPGWSEVVKKLWDEDTRLGVKLRVAILGSSALLLEKGLSESLTGRFEVSFFPHWTFSEIRKLIPGATVDDYRALGGYPKAYSFNDRERARSYLEHSILEPSLGRDILALHSVEKPALLRQLFWFVSKLPAQIVSFDKLLGSLQDRGNSATIAHYAELLSLAFLVVPIYKFSRATHRTKRSLPKWIFPNPALITAIDSDSTQQGFLIENLVGAHLLNLTYGATRYQLSYWRERDREIDYILLDQGNPVLALEVKSSRKKSPPSQEAINQAGLTCPAGNVNAESLEDFLLTGSVEEAIKVATR